MRSKDNVLKTHHSENQQNTVGGTCNVDFPQILLMLGKRMLMAVNHERLETMPGVVEARGCDVDLPHNLRTLETRMLTGNHVRLRLGTMPGVVGRARC